MDYYPIRAKLQLTKSKSNYSYVAEGVALPLVPFLLFMVTPETKKYKRTYKNIKQIWLWYGMGWGPIFLYHQ